MSLKTQFNALTYRNGKQRNRHNRVDHAGESKSV